MKGKIVQGLLATALFSLPLTACALTEAQCLASIIYKEARGESVKGKLGVAHVALNRSTLYDKSVCAVMRQKGQFSWMRGKHSLPKLAEIAPILPMADKLLAEHHLGIRKDITKGSTHFIKKSLRNYWTVKFKRVIVLDNHAFYKQPVKAS